MCLCDCLPCKLDGDCSNCRLDLDSDGDYEKGELCNE